MTKIRGTASAAVRKGAVDASRKSTVFTSSLHGNRRADSCRICFFWGQNRHKSVCKEAPGIMFIITPSSIRRTIPVAFIIKLPVSVESYPFRKKKIAHFLKNFAVRQRKKCFFTLSRHCTHDPAQVQRIWAALFCASPNCGYPKTKTTAFLSKFKEVGTEAPQTAAFCSRVTALLFNVAKMETVHGVIKLNRTML